MPILKWFTVMLVPTNHAPANCKLPDEWLNWRQTLLYRYSRSLQALKFSSRWRPFLHLGADNFCICLGLCGGDTETFFTWNRWKMYSSGIFGKSVFKLLPNSPLHYIFYQSRPCRGTTSRKLKRYNKVYTERTENDNRNDI